MKKTLLASFSILLINSLSLAEPFSPTPLEITVQDEVIYAFDGNDIAINVDVAGKPCRAYLFINTRLPEDEKPEKLRNGNRGWHYVNNIDTTVYISGPNDLAIGPGQVITWNGVGSENTRGIYGGPIEPSGKVPVGTYDYYIFGWDDENSRERVCNFVCISYYWYSQYVRIGEFDDYGLPRIQPYLWGNTNWYSHDLHALNDENGNVIGNAEDWNSHGPPLNAAFKFPIGSDPDDMSAMHTTFMPGFSSAPGEELSASPVVFDPNDESIFYCFHDRITQKNGALFKWNWVEGGNAAIDENWGGFDKLLFETMSERGMEEHSVAASTDGEYLYLTSPGRDSTLQWDRFYMVGFDGKVVANQNLDDFYTPEQSKEEYRNGMVNRLFTSRSIPFQALIGGEQHCLMMMIATDRLAAGDTYGYVKWTNGNGDFFLDASWDPIDTPAELLWQCNTGDFRSHNGGHHNEQSFDLNGIIIHHSDYQGPMSFVVFTQDGSGVAYGRFVDDRYGLGDGPGTQLGSGQICDTGSAYDGMYKGLSFYSLFELYITGTDRECVNWIGMDSAHGVITDKPIFVEEEKQESFKVDAPYPNPANPTSTIGFTLAEAGHVTIDIYNIAGQKIETLANGAFDTGKHSVVWDGSNYSAGIYFCTVESGGLSDTVKMTLIK
ncbi:T9SS type A sorting domain-containing protein [Candidatus Latescibacterota bacterium]